MLVIGLTGGIGTGKSTVTSKFEALGVPVIDADTISRELVERGSPALARIAQAFGASVIDADGNLDRAAMRKRVFASAKDLALLESILHPAVRAEIAKRTSKLSNQYCILSIPLLIESGFTDLVDRVLVIDASENTQLSRAANRDGVSEKEIREIISTQCSREDRLKQADDLIDNNGNKSDLDEQIEELHGQYLDLANTGI